MDNIQGNGTGRAPGVSAPSKSTADARIDPEALIDSAETAKLLRLQPQTLATWRAEKRGPRYVKIGRACFYMRADIERWIAQQLRGPDIEAA
jgi:hypothetical protein